MQNNLTNEEIMAIAAATNYAALYIDRTTRLGPGRDDWAAQLAKLTPGQRLTLETRLEQWDRIRLRSATKSNAVPVGRMENTGPAWKLQRLA